MADAEKPSSSSIKHIFTAPDCKIVGVVVYPNRAEISRNVTIKVVPGENEVTLKGFTKHIDSNSIRVESKGPASITEVTYQAKDEDISKELKKKIESLRKKQSILLEKAQRFVKQKAALEDVADSVKCGGPISKKDDGDGQNFLDSKFLGNMSNFLEFYMKWATDIDDNIHQIEVELGSIEKEIRLCQQNFELPWLSTEINILLDAAEAGEVDLAFSYVTSKAKWTPTYDIRAFSNEKNLKFHYYGMIKQSTEEDWIDAKLSLSTSVMPNTDGTAPTLGKMRIELKKAASMYTVEPSIDGEALNTESGQMVNTKESTTLTTFEVAERATIPSGKSEHKVTIGKFDLDASLDYRSVPKKIAQAFLKAKGKNTSVYTLLAGSANIFLDSKFNTKTKFQAVRPTEEFECSLGANPAIQVTYQPNHKYREHHRRQSGILSIPTVRTTCHQTMQIKNTSAVPINIKVTDHLPRSADERIRVYLVEPVIPYDKEDKSIDVTFNRNANIEWNLLLDADSTKDLLLKYIVEHPAGEEIDVYTSC